MADQDPFSQSEQEEAARVNRIEKEQLAWSNILKLKLDINRASKEEATFTEQIAKLQGEEVKNANKYKNQTEAILRAEKMILKAQQAGNTEREKGARAAKAMFEARQKESLRTTGGALKAMELEAKKRKENLTTEQKLIKDINKERGIGAKITDLFRTKEQKQKSIDLARAKVGGGANTGPASPPSKSFKESLQESTVGRGLTSAMGGIAAGASAAMGATKELGSQVQKGLTSSLASAANLLTGEDYGMGGGKANASGATSILGGLSSVLRTIPLVGGILGGVVDGFKAMLDAVLGIEQANFRVARALNISVEEASGMRDQFDKIANASDNIVVNSTRLLQSQVEISKQLGTNQQLNADILENDVKLRDVLGLEAQSRQQIAESSIITGRNATKLTQSVIGTVGSFNKLVGTSFKFNDIIAEASKMSGVIGLTFSKFPEKITKTIMSVKTLGFDLKQLDSTADSFLDFESSISKEMEAQVLTGKDMNLTAAREAALNNDNAALAREITKNVGDANAYLKMNRIQQEAIAGAVGMSRDGLADVLKKQELYSKLNATDAESFNKKIELLEKQKDGQEQISKLLGKDAYNTYTQVSTAEKLSEIMERIKKTFVDFVKNSGLFDFITDPAKINTFIKGMADKLASMISTIGEVIATLIEGVGSVASFFGGDGDKYRTMAEKVRSGAGDFSQGVRSTANSLGGAVAGSISGTKEAGAKQEGSSGGTAGTSSGNQSSNQPIELIVYTTVDGEVIAKSSSKYAPNIYGQNTK